MEGYFQNVNYPFSKYYTPWIQKWNKVLSFETLILLSTSPPLFTSYWTLLAAFSCFQQLRNDKSFVFSWVVMIVDICLTQKRYKLMFLYDNRMH